ncbi:MAG: zinc ribbon domain-containing protein [Bacteroidales bacterium]|nr:zinc ribbon domain-containing protein [Bacteroidales bacterium]
MKFCPQCGTTFESDARFCLECGFDRYSVEPGVTETTAEPGVKVSETPPTPVTPVSLPKSQMEAIPRCPQCSHELVINDRFCQECGFDTSVSMITATEVSHSIQQPQTKETFPSNRDTEEPVSPPVKKQFCQQCGSGIDIGKRFCQECGFDTLSGQKADALNPEPVYLSPVVETPTPAKPVILPISPEPFRSAAPVSASPFGTREPAQHQKGKKTWLWIVLIILGAGALGTAGWFGYNKYFAPTYDTNTDVNTNVKPMSLMDQELAKQKAKAQNQGTPQGTTSPRADESQEAPENDMIPQNDIISQVILEVGRKEVPKNKNPKNPAKLSIRKATMITRITTDHYNDGMGTARGGIITIMDHNGINIGRYKALGKTGKNATPSAKWVAEPNIMLDKGTYLIGDSEPATWSKTFIGNNGFIVVEGYEIE